MKTPRSILERRRAIRVHEELPFRIGHQDYEAQAKTINISIHGALCVVDKSVPLMTQLAVAVTLPSGKSSKSKGKLVRMKGVVVRREKDDVSNKFFIAIYFSEISPKDREVLANFIESRVSERS